MLHADTAGFAAALPERGRLGGLDVGTRTIGLAACDARWTIASPHRTLDRVKFSVDVALLLDWAKAERLVGLVVGLPLSMDGSDSPRTQSVRAFARNLEARTPLPLLLWDERWSTAAVERHMIDADISRARRAVLVDKLAAAHILQGAIDALTWQRPDATL